MQEVEREYHDRIKELVRAKKNDELDELWLTIVEDGVRSHNFHESVVRYFLNRKEEERLQSMYELLLSARIKSGDFQHALELLELLLVPNPNQELFRPYIVDALKGVHSESEPENIAEYLRISGLDGETPNLLQALRSFEELVGASRGMVFRHNQWGLGVVRELEPRSGRAVVDFARKPNHAMTIEGIKRFLIRVPNDHLLARIAKAPEELKREMADDPSAIVRLALRGSGGKIKATDLKKLFLDHRLMTDGDYKKWWNKAKDAVRLDPYIDMTGNGSNILLTLRSEPRSFVDEIFTRFLEAKNVEDRRNVLRDVLRHGDRAEMSTEDVQALFALFKKPLEDGIFRTPAERFGHGLLFEEFSSLFPEGAENPVNVDEILTHPEYHPGRMIVEIGVFELQRLGLEHAARLRESEAEQFFAEAIFGADAKMMAWMERTLPQRGMGDVLDHCVERVLSDPGKNPDVFVWAGKKVIDGQLPHVAESIPPLSICSSAAVLSSELEDQAAALEGKEQKQMQLRAARVRAILQEGHCKHLKKALKDADVEQARRFLATIGMLGNLTNQLRSTITDLVYYHHQGLRKLTRAEEEAEAKVADFHYTTADSLDQKRRELSHILNVEIPANSEAIGTARELGDLRENAEYHAAKDRQKLLMQQAADLKELIDRARVIDLAGVQPDQVRFGTTVQLVNRETGEVEGYTLLGMWEADLPNGIISYVTPFGSQLIGRTLGEEFDVVLPDGRQVPYQVESIERAGVPHQETNA